MSQPSIPPSVVAAQERHVQEARENPELRATTNRGKPPIAATARPGDFKSNVVASRQAGGEYHAPPANDMRSNVPRFLPSQAQRWRVTLVRPSAHVSIGGPSSVTDAKS